MSERIREAYVRVLQLLDRLDHDLDEPCRVPECRHHLASAHAAGQASDEHRS